MRGWVDGDGDTGGRTDPNATTRPPFSFTAEFLQPGQILCSRPASSAIKTRTTRPIGSWGDGFKNQMNYFLMFNYTEW